MGRYRKRKRERGRAAGAVLVLASALLAGCTLGPDPQRPTTAADAATAFVNGGDREASAEGGATAVSPWWERFGDPATSELVRLALAANTDLQGSAARVLEAEASLKRARGARRPQAIASVSARRQKSSFVLPEMGRVATYATSYSDDLSVSYVLDLFGKLKRSAQSASASLMAERAAQEALQHSVISQVVRARVQVATLEHSLEITREIRDSWEKTLATVERRYRSGLVQAVDLYLARENLSATRATEEQLAGQLAQARHALDVLVGRRPGTGAVLRSSLPELPDPQAVPVGLPADLLDRRPDVRQAEMQLAAATYGVGVALADLFPSLTLSGSAGTVSDSVSDLTSSDGIVYNAVASLLGPVFTGGQRRAEVRAARARVDQLTAAYAGAILTALREVEDALVGESSTRARLEHTRRRVEEARAADRLARDRYQRGVESLLKVLETERRLRSAEDALIATRADLWNARISLHLALGGDWQAEAGSGAEQPRLAAHRRATAADPQSAIRNPQSEIRNPKSPEVSS